MTMNGSGIAASLLGWGGSRVYCMLATLVMLFYIFGCSGEGDKPSPAPVAGSSADTEQARPDEDVLSVLGVKGTRPTEANTASGLRIEVSEPKFDVGKKQPETAPLPARASPLDF